MKQLTCLVTGANSGIGAGLAHLLAAQGHHVILCCRTMAKAETAISQIQQQLPQASLEPLAADLADPQAIHTAVTQFTARHHHLDVLCNIAGATFYHREETSRGIEKNLAINHLGPFQLTLALLPALKAAPEARIVNVVGEFHRKAKLQLDDLEWKQRSYSVMRSGAAAMLMRVMFTYELARRLKGTNITANCFHPGAVRSNLLKNFPWPIRLIGGWIKLFFISPEKGADTGAWLATAPEAARINGKYLIRRKVVASSPTSQKEETAQKLWEISEKYLREFAPWKTG